MNMGATRTESERLHTFFESEWERTLSESPLFASELGDRRFNSVWPDASVEGISRRHRQNQEALEMLGTFNIHMLSSDDRLNLELFRRTYEIAIGEHDLRWHLLPLSAR